MQRKTATFLSFPETTREVGFVIDPSKCKYHLRNWLILKGLGFWIAVYFKFCQKVQKIHFCTSTYIKSDFAMVFDLDYKLVNGFSYQVHKPSQTWKSEQELLHRVCNYNSWRCQGRNLCCQNGVENNNPAIPISGGRFTKKGTRRYMHTQHSTVQYWC